MNDNKGSNRKTVVAFGEALWDLLPEGKVLGGAPLNFAYRVNSLGDQALMISRLGTDDLGDEALDQMKVLGMDTTYIQRDAQHPTGTVEVTLDENRNPDYHIVPSVAYDHIEAASDLSVAVREADCICFGSLVQRTPTSRQTLYHLLEQTDAATKLADVNLRKDCYSKETLSESLERTNILKLNDVEVKVIADWFGVSGDSIESFAEAAIDRWRLSHCLITLAERGAFARSAAGDLYYQPGFKVQVADAIGAGDAFTAGFVHELLSGQSLDHCCRFGCGLGALVATQSGATEPVTRDEILSFVSSKPDVVAEPTLERYRIE